MAFDKALKSSKAEYDRSGETHSFELWDKCFAEANAGNFTPTIERNEKGEILAPNGMVSRLPNEDFVKVTRTPTFKSWFGDWVSDSLNSSKVVYEDTGEPMVVYHGTDKHVPQEEGLLIGTGENSKYLIDKIISRKTAYFTGSQAYVNHFSSMHGNVESATFGCFLNIVDITKYINNSRHKIGLLFKIGGGSDGFVFRNRKNGVIFGVFNTKNIMHLPSDIKQKNSNW